MTATISAEAKPSRSSWTNALVSDLVHTFTKHGLEATRKHMIEKHGITGERTDEQLAKLSLLVLDPDEIAAVDLFSELLGSMDKPSRTLALQRLRAAVKAMR